MFDFRVAGRKRGNRNVKLYRGYTSSSRVPNSRNILETSLTKQLATLKYKVNHAEDQKLRSSIVERIDLDRSHERRTYFFSIFTKDYAPLSLTVVRAKCQASLQLGHPVDEGKRLRANVPITTQEHKDSLPQFSYCDRLRHVLHPLSSLARSLSPLCSVALGRLSSGPIGVENTAGNRSRPDGEEIREAWDHAARIKGWTRRGKADAREGDHPLRQRRTKKPRWFQGGKKKKKIGIAARSCVEPSFLSARRRAIKIKKKKFHAVREREKSGAAFI